MICRIILIKPIENIPHTYTEQIIARMGRSTFLYRVLTIVRTATYKTHKLFENKGHLCHLIRPIVETTMKTRNKFYYKLKVSKKLVHTKVWPNYMHWHQHSQSACRILVDMQTCEPQTGSPFKTLPRHCGHDSQPASSDSIMSYGNLIGLFIQL